MTAPAEALVAVSGLQRAHSRDMVLSPPTVAPASPLRVAAGAADAWRSKVEPILLLGRSSPSGVSARHPAGWAPSSSRISRLRESSPRSRWISSRMRSALSIWLSAHRSISAPFLPVISPSILRTGACLRPTSLPRCSMRTRCAFSFPRRTQSATMKSKLAQPSKTSMGYQCPRLTLAVSRLSRPLSLVASWISAVCLSLS